MASERFYELIEAFRKETIGEPEWIADKNAFEYKETSPKTVAVLKLVRAAQGVSAIETLCMAGLFVDAGALMRCVFDCADEATFLLEEYPNASNHVEKFVKAFFESTIDGYLDGNTSAVETKKIRSAVVRALKGNNDDATLRTKERIYKTFSGYIHANYAHIMEMYNGGGPHDFNLRGVPSQAQRQEKLEYVPVAQREVALAAALVAQRLEKHEFAAEFLKL